MAGPIHPHHHFPIFTEPCTMELAWRLHGAAAPMGTCSATCRACASSGRVMTAAVSGTRRTVSGWRVSSTGSPTLRSWSTSARGSWRSSALSCRTWWRSKGELRKHLKHSMYAWMLGAFFFFTFFLILLSPLVQVHGWGDRREGEQLSHDAAGEAGAGCQH